MIIKALARSKKEKAPGASTADPARPLRGVETRPLNLCGEWTPKVMSFRGSVFGILNE
jgi:hypothetical protein